MSLATPTTKDLSDGIVTQLQASLGQTIPILPKAFLRVLSVVLAGSMVLVYKYAGFIFLQLFPAYASMDETTVNGKKIRPLVEWGRLIGVGDPLAAVQAEHLVQVTVLSQVGSLAAGTQLVRSETGVIYRTVADVALNAATIQVTMRAAAAPGGADGSGTIGNLNVGDAVSFANKPANVASTVTVLSTSVSGADAETPDAYRRRIFQRMQRHPQGGAYADYWAWGKEPVGVANIYPYTGSPGQVDVYVECTTDINADGIPTAPILTAVTNAIQLTVAGLATRRPVNDAVNVLAITRSTFDFIVLGLVVADTLGCQAAIATAVGEHLRSLEPFIVGLSSLPRTDRITRVAVGGIVDGVVASFGGTITGVQVRQGGVSIEAYTLGKGEKAKAGAFTYN